MSQMKLTVIVCSVVLNRNDLIGSCKKPSWSKLPQATSDMPLSPFSICCGARLQFVGTYDTFICTACNQIIPPRDENKALSSPPPPDKKVGDTNTSSPHDKDYADGVWFQVQDLSLQAAIPQTLKQSRKKKILA